MSGYARFSVKILVKRTFELDSNKWLLLTYFEWKRRWIKSLTAHSSCDLNIDPATNNNNYGDGIKEFVPFIPKRALIVKRAKFKITSGMCQDVAMQHALLFYDLFFVIIYEFPQQTQFTQKA